MKKSKVVPFAGTAADSSVLCEPTSEASLATTYDPDSLDVGYNETVSETVCVIDIHGIQLRRPIIFSPDKSRPVIIYDPLAKFWSVLRRRILDYWQLSIAGIFTYDEAQELVTCRFYPDRAAIDKLGIHIGDNTYHALFADTFPEWAKFFETNFEEWLTAEDGYVAYLAMIDKGEPDPERYRKYFNRYLKARKLRTHADELRSAAKRRQA